MGFGIVADSQGFTILDVQRCAFVGNSATTRGALDISPAATPQSANILNCSFLGNTLNAKKGLATVTKRYGGAALWADMTETTIPLNIGLCTFMGNHLTFDGTDANFGGAAVAIYKGKVCLMDNLILANDRKIGSAAPAWNDLYTVTNDVNVWRDTYNLYSASAEIDGWENTITATFGGTLHVLNGSIGTVNDKGELTDTFTKFQVGSHSDQTVTATFSDLTFAGLLNYTQQTGVKDTASGQSIAFATAAARPAAGATSQNVVLKKIDDQDHDGLTQRGGGHQVP